MSRLDGRSSFLRSLIAGALLGATALSASATLLGSEVAFEYYFDFQRDAAGPAPANFRARRTVGDGLELTFEDLFSLNSGGVRIFDGIDFQADRIIIDLTENASSVAANTWGLNGIVLAFEEGTLDGLLGVEYVDPTPDSFPPESLTRDGDRLLLNWVGLPVVADSETVLALTFAQARPDPEPPSPELGVSEGPASALALLGLLGLGLRRLRLR